VERNELTRQIIGAAMRVHSAVGPGLLESVYRTCLHFELTQIGLKVQAEFPIPIVYGGVQLDVGYRVDFLVEDVVLVELKALTTMLPVHEAQLLSYVRMSNRPIGLLINFHVLHLRDGIRRLVNEFPRKSNQ
jgi:GxxExxY protein